VGVPARSAGGAAEERDAEEPDERLDDQGRDRMLLGLRVGDPYDEVAEAWLAKESVRDIYLVDDPADAATLLDKTITGCREDDVPEIQSLGHTLSRWRTEILNHHTTGASNGPTEGLNLVIEKSNEPATDSADSTTTGSAASSTPAASPGPTVPPHPASEPANPHSDETSPQRSDSKPRFSTSQPRSLVLCGRRP